MAKPRRFLEACFGGCLVALLAGCGSGLHPVQGKVTLDGQPVEKASVLFEPVAGGPLGYGNTDAQGRFTLINGSATGVPAGEYRVAITKQKVTGVREDETVAPGGVRIHWLIPEKYSKAASSGLTIKVPAEQYEFALTSK